MSRIDLKDDSYHKKALRIAEIISKHNPDGLPPERQIRFGKDRVMSVTLRYIIDNELQRLESKIQDGRNTK